MDVRLLGPVEIADGGRVIRIPAAKQRALLSLLALRAGQVVPLETVVEGVWTDPPATAAHAVSVYVSMLRRLLAPAPLRRHGPGYLLDVDAASVDALRFEQLADAASDALAAADWAGAVGRARESLELWRGPALVDARAGWLQLEAERLDERRLAVRELCLEGELRLGLVDAAANDAARLVAEHPLRAPAVRLLMLALDGSSRQADALAAFRRYRALLDAELGLPPSQDLRDLEAAILREEVAALPAARPVRRSGSSAPATSFVGRRRELAELVPLLAGDEMRLLTITGPGGVGKTRVALRVLDDAASSFRDGACYVPLAALRDPELVVPAIAAALGLREYPSRPIASVVSEHLAERELLLVLDNFEQVIAAAEHLAALIAAVPALTTVVTSRAPLRLQAERIYDLSPLEPAEAHRLFVERARAVDASFSLAADDEPAVARLCERLDGLPLALELAAARVRALSPQRMLALVDRRLDVLSTGARDADRRHAALEATIAWSHDLLAPPHRELLVSLSVFAGGFTLEAAELVCGGDVLEGVAALVEHSLVRRRGERYSMLETIRDFGRSRLDGTSKHAELERRHAHCFIALAERAEPELWDVEQADWAARLDDDRENLRAALAWALGADDDAALRLAAALAPYWETRGLISEGLRWLSAALQREARSNPAARARALFGASRLVSIEGSYDEERELLAEAVELYEQASDQRHLVFSLAHLGVNQARLDQAAADATAERAVTLARALGDRWFLAMALNCRAIVLLDGERRDSALPAIEESLAIRRGLQEKRGIAVTVATLGELHLASGRSEEAIDPLAEALSLARELGNVALEAPFVTSLGLAALGARQADRARALLLRGLEVSTEIADLETSSEALAGLAALELDGNVPLARNRYERAQTIRATLGTKPRAHARPTFELVARRLTA